MRYAAFEPQGGCPMEKKLLIVNVKHYRNAVGNSAETFLKECPDSAGEEWDLIFAIGTYDSTLAERFKKKKFYSQHVDDVGFGAYTGKVSIDLLLERGFSGSILNHSENRIPIEKIESTVARAREKRFPIVVCAENLDEIRKVVRFQPVYVAYEPKELIGGDVSVSTARPEVISEAADICRNAETRLIVGAGVKNRKDVSRSMELGASGVLVASGVVLSQDPGKTIASLAEE